MAISYRGASNAAGQFAGTAATATTVSITPTLPTGTVTGDRVFVVACATNTSGTTPTGWNVVGTKDTVIGSGAVAATSGLRYMTVYWRDYDGVWSMPAFTLTSAAQNGQWIGAVSITPTAGQVFNTPKISTVGAAFNSAATAYTDTTAASFTTHSGGFLIIGTALNDSVTSTSPALSQSGATFGTVTERCDGGGTTGNDLSGQVHTCAVTTGAAATVTFTQTLSAASQGETLVVEQTEISATGIVHVDSGITNAASVTIPAHLVGDLLIVTAWAASATPPAVGSTYTSITTASSATVSARIGYRVADGTANDDSGTWTGAAVCTVGVYRRVGTPGASASNVGTSASIDYPAITSTVSGSWAYRSAATLASNTVPTAPLTGFVFRAGQANVGSFDSNGPLANPAAGSQTVDVSEAWNAFTVEIPPAGAAAPTPVSAQTNWSAMQRANLY